MKKNRSNCETCQFRGYSSDFCKFHKKEITKLEIGNCPPQSFYRKIGKKAVLGAGVGVVAATAGLAVVPAVGLKAAIGHLLAAKITAGGGAAGAGINVARNARKKYGRARRYNRRNVLLPLYLNKRS